MKYTVQEYKDKFCVLVGDTAKDLPDIWFINALNWAMNGLPTIPKLGKLFSKRYTFNLDAEGHYRWKLNGDFRRLIDIPMLNFYTTSGGDPCKTTVCYKSPEEFYDINGIIEMKQPGTPCQYTVEQEDDGIYLVLDRPLDIPMIIQYIAYGYPMPVKSMDDIVEISAIADPLIFSVIKEAWFQEADDWGFSGAVGDYVDNKLIPEANQALHKKWGHEGPAVVGGA